MALLRCCCLIGVPIKSSSWWGFHSASPFSFIEVLSHRQPYLNIIVFSPSSTKEFNKRLKKIQQKRWFSHLFSGICFVSMVLTRNYRWVPFTEFFLVRLAVGSSIFRYLGSTTGRWNCASAKYKCKCRTQNVSPSPSVWAVVQESSMRAKQKRIKVRKAFKSGTFTAKFMAMI